ncbi:MAG: 4-hydroxy-tetrahydrodipicolinate reductase, partial [Oscillospiraceae bacterium]|nr:4-hydroxy-tetrahydrodipicolinate reductase [Oscillospiraceae bacterium]
MLNILLRGCNGRMGRAVSAICEGRSDTVIAAGLDTAPGRHFAYPVYALPAEFRGKADAAIDFSRPEGIEAFLDYCVRRRLPLALATTGFDAEAQTRIEAASRHIPVFQSGNMSLGVNLLTDLVRRAVSVLGEEYDVEIIERHHNQKLDAPSGTAYMLFGAASEALPYDPEPCYHRHQRRVPRPAREIGMHAVRGGTVVGEHEGILAGRAEVITL